MLADTAGDERRRSDAETERGGVEEGQHRFREADRRDGVRAEAADEVHVDDGEDTFESHLEDHRYGEEQDGPCDRAFRVVLPGSVQCFAHRGPEAWAGGHVRK